MACDIHVHIEQQVNGTWEHYSTLTLQQDYGLFRALTNNAVRPVNRASFNDLDLKLENPKGLPNDICLTTELAYMYAREDYHSTSWLLADKFEKIVSKYYTKDTNRITNKVGFFYGSLYNDYPSFVKGVRLVFWFDN